MFNIVFVKNDLTLAQERRNTDSITVQIRILNLYVGLENERVSLSLVLEIPALLLKHRNYKT